MVDTLDKSKFYTKLVKHAKWLSNPQDKKCSQADFSNLDLSMLLKTLPPAFNFNLSGAIFKNCKIKNIDFNSKIIFDSCDFSGSEFENVTFSNIKSFENVDLSNSRLKNVVFENFKVKNVNVRGSIIESVTLNNTYISGLNLSGAYIKKYTLDSVTDVSNVLLDEKTYFGFKDVCIDIPVTNSVVVTENIVNPLVKGLEMFISEKVYLRSKDLISKMFPWVETLPFGKFLSGISPILLFHVLLHLDSEKKLLTPGQRILLNDIAKICSEMYFNTIINESLLAPFLEGFTENKYLT